MREWIVRSAKGNTARVTARTPFTAAVAAVRSGELRSFGWIIQVDAKGVERCYTSTKKVFLAAGKGWPKNMPEHP